MVCTYTGTISQKRLMKKWPDWPLYERNISWQQLQSEQPLVFRAWISVSSLLMSACPLHLCPLMLFRPACLPSFTFSLLVSWFLVQSALQVLLFCCLLLFTSSSTHSCTTVPGSIAFIIEEYLLQTEEPDIRNRKELFFFFFFILICKRFGSKML